MSYDNWLAAPYDAPYWTTCRKCGDEECWTVRPPADHPELCAVCEGIHNEEEQSDD